MHRVCMQRHLLSNECPLCPLCRAPIAEREVIATLQGVSDAIIIETVSTRVRASIQRAAQELLELHQMQAEFNAV